MRFGSGLLGLFVCRCVEHCAVEVRLKLRIKPNARVALRSPSAIPPPSKVKGSRQRCQVALKLAQIGAIYASIGISRRPS